MSGRRGSVYDDDILPSPPRGGRDTLKRVKSSSDLNYKATLRKDKNRYGDDQSDRDRSRREKDRDRDRDRDKSRFKESERDKSRFRESHRDRRELDREWDRDRERDRYSKYREKKWDREDDRDRDRERSRDREKGKERREQYKTSKPSSSSSQSARVDRSSRRKEVLFSGDHRYSSSTTRDLETSERERTTMASRRRANSTKRSLSDGEDESRGEEISDKEDLTDDQEYSSEEEVQVGDKKIKKGRRSSTVNREALLSPKEVDGWLLKYSPGKIFNGWKKYWFHLQYPYIQYYKQQPIKNLGVSEVEPRGSVSVRGGCMVDEALVDDKKHSAYAATRLKVKSGPKVWVLQMPDREAKAVWANAIRTNIYFANPAKRVGGVSYDVYVNDDFQNLMKLKVELRSLSLINPKSGVIVWQRPIFQLRALLSAPGATNILCLDFCEYGGTVKLITATVPSKTLQACISGIIDTHLDWRGSPILEQ